MLGPICENSTAVCGALVLRQREFEEHQRIVKCRLCDSVLSYAGSRSEGYENVYDSKAASHIAEMIYMIENDKAPPESDYGPCVEFILQHDVLGTLQKHAQNDVPVGIRKIVLTFLSQLIQKLPRSALPHLHIHRPLQDMLCICGSGKYPIDEINFITSILGKFHEDPSLVNLFMNETLGRNGSKGPCVEFILQHDVLGTLQKHAQIDVPVGIRKIVLTFLSQLIQKLPRSALPHLHIHRPLQDMLCICGSGKYPIDEINFITSILGKFHEDPSLVNLFMNETLGRNGSKSYELRLLDALISLSHLKDDRVVKKSCESLLLCVAADSEYVIDNILSYTILVQDLVSRLCQRYGSLRAEPSVLLYTNVSWTSQLEHTIAEHTDSSAIRLLLWANALTSDHSSYALLNRVRPML
eukprot:sb/3465167/